MERSRRNHSSKFKARVALEALRGDATLTELGSRHGVHATQIAAWRKQALEHLSEVFDHGNPVLEDAERHIRDLRAKVGMIIPWPPISASRPWERHCAATAPRRSSTPTRAASSPARTSPACWPQGVRISMDGKGRDRQRLRRSGCGEA